MEYLFLLYTDGSACKATASEATTQAIKQHWEIMDEAAAKGVFKGARPLYGIDTARTFRAGGYGVTMTDGPHAETKEFLGGYYCIECASPEEAQYWAEKLARVPTLLGVEVRPLMPVPERIPEEVPAAASV